MTEENKAKLGQVWYYIAAAVVGAILTFVISYKQESRFGYQDLIDKLAEDNRRLELRISALERENISLTARIEVLTYSSFDSPLPAWVKSVDGRMLSMNNAYETVFLKPNGRVIDDYIGKTDEEFWGELGQSDLGKSYWKSDLRVLATGAVQRTRASGYINGVLREFIVYKYPYYAAYGITSPKKEIVGVAGVAVMLEDEN